MDMYVQFLIVASYDVIFKSDANLQFYMANNNLYTS